MKKAFICALCFIGSMLILAGCQTESETVEKNVVEGYSLSPAMTIETMTEDAAWIVYGTVAEQGESYVHTETTNDGDAVSMIVTPFQIEVIDCLKGNAQVGEKILYIQRGGETDTTIERANDGCEVSVGEEILIFLNEGNATWGAAQGVRKIENGTVSIEKRMLPTALYDTGEESAIAELALSDLQDLVALYVNE